MTGAGFRALVLVLAGCVHCHQVICRACDEDPWRSLPTPEQRVLLPQAAVACDARPGRLPHQSPAEVS